MLGATTWIASFLLKLTPIAWLKKIPVRVDENKAETSDPLMKLYKSQAQGKVLGQKTAGGATP